MAVCRARVALIRWHQRCARDVIERHGCRKRRQVVGADMSCRLEARGELDECRFAERRSEETDAHGTPNAMPAGTCTMG